MRRRDTDFDAHAALMERADAMAAATWFPPNTCTGSCNQGRACDCIDAVPAPIESVEKARPWVWLVYVVTVLVPIAYGLLVDWMQ